MNLAKIPTFAAPGVFHVVVETPRGATVKLKYEPRWEAMSVSRPLPIGVIYPYDWGFVPSTGAADGDPVDAFVLWDVASYPGMVLPCRALGVLQVEQNRTNFDGSARIRNDRVLALPEATRRERHLTTVADLSRRVRDELEQFVMSATALEGKDPSIVGWDGPEAALALLEQAARQSVL